MPDEDKNLLFFSNSSDSFTVTRIKQHSFLQPLMFFYFYITCLFNVFFFPGTTPNKASEVFLCFLHVSPHL